jgi:CxxC-x17-CxxC domain-containing protein
MGNFGKPSFGDRGGNRSFAGNKRSGGGNRGGGSRFGGGGFRDRDSAERTMFSTTCDRCKNQCEVPFKPNGTKEVLCNDCFKSDSNNDRSHGRDNDRPSFGSRDRDSRDGGSRGGDFKKREERTHNTDTWKPTGENTGELKAKIEKLEQKIDELIKFLAPTSVAPKSDKSLKNLIAEATDVAEVKTSKAKKEVAKKDVKASKAKPAKAVKETKAPKAKKEVAKKDVKASKAKAVKETKAPKAKKEVAKKDVKASKAKASKK